MKFVGAIGVILLISCSSQMVRNKCVRWGIMWDRDMNIGRQGTQYRKVCLEWSQVGEVKNAEFID